MRGGIDVFENTRTVSHPECLSSMDISFVGFLKDNTGLRISGVLQGRNGGFPNCYRICLENLVDRIGKVILSTDRYPCS